MAEKRAQAAMEFLMTYGWAIIVVLVAIGALVYFGILDLSFLFPSKCILPAGITCLDFDVKTSEVTLALQNNIGLPVSIDKITVTKKGGTPCTYSTPKTLQNNGKATITLTNCNHGSAGERFDGEINVTYTNLDTQLTHKSRGNLAAKLSEGPPPPPPQPGSYANFVCPSLVSGINDLSADPIQVWQTEYGNNMPGGDTICYCPTGSTIEQITYEVDVEPPNTNDYLQIGGAIYSGTSSATIGWGRRSVRLRFNSNSAISYNDGATQYEGAKVTMINCYVPVPPPGASIKVAVEQHPELGDSDSGADNVVNQLNDNNYGFNLGSVRVSGKNIDTVSELNNYDVVVIGSSDWNWVYEDYDQFDNVLEQWVSSGGGVVATGEIMNEVSSSDMEEGIVAILPVAAGSPTNAYGVSPTDAAHPVTQGVSFFATGNSNPCLPPLMVKAGSSTLGQCYLSPNKAIVVWAYGSGRVVYLAPEYMRWLHPELRSGEADQLLEQAVKWANG